MKNTHLAAALSAGDGIFAPFRRRLLLRLLDVALVRTLWRISAA